MGAIALMSSGHVGNLRVISRRYSRTARRWFCLQNQANKVDNPAEVASIGLGCRVARWPALLEEKRIASAEAGSAGAHGGGHRQGDFFI